MHKIKSILICSLLIITCHLANAAPNKNWTLLIYMNGNNSLDDDMQNSIKNMETVGSSDQINVVVQFASLSAGKTIRMYITRSTNPDQITSKVLQDLGSIDMGDYRNLQDFIAWGIQNYPAGHYFIEIDNHGSGWHSHEERYPPAKTQKFKTKDISNDENTNNVITTEQLGQVMQNASRLIGHKIDIYGSDACLMGMIEVAEEMSDSVNYYIGSQNVESSNGWPYADILSIWEAHPNASSRQVTQYVIDKYINANEKGHRGAFAASTMSAYDTSKTAALNEAITRLGANLSSLDAAEREKVIDAINKAQKFNDLDYPDYVDLVDFANQLTSANIPGLDPQIISEFRAAAQVFIVENKTTKNTPFPNASGISVWLPLDEALSDKYFKRYQALKFTVATQWDKALNHIKYN